MLARGPAAANHHPPKQVVTPAFLLLFLLFPGLYVPVGLVLALSSGPPIFRLVHLSKRGNSDNNLDILLCVYGRDLAFFVSMTPLSSPPDSRPLSRVT